MTRYKIINNEKIPFTSEEESLRNIEEKAWADGKFNRAIENLRQKRNALLSATDFHALSDNTMSDEMKQYRQDLRDITEGLATEQQVKDTEFPTKPE